MTATKPLEPKNNAAFILKENQAFIFLPGYRNYLAARCVSRRGDVSYSSSLNSPLSGYCTGSARSVLKSSAFLLKTNFNTAG